MPVEMRDCFIKVEVLTGILSVEPVSSCKAESSVSELRRLKSWLWAAMVQGRLNVVVCKVHKDRLEKLSIKITCQQFV